MVVSNGAPATLTILCGTVSSSPLTAILNDGVEANTFSVMKMPLPDTKNVRPDVERSILTDPHQCSCADALSHVTVGSLNRAFVIMLVQVFPPFLDTYIWSPHVVAPVRHG